MGRSPRRQREAIEFMTNPFDTQFLNNSIVAVVKDVFLQLCHVEPLTEPAILERDIIEYDGRMRLSPMEKFNGPAYAAAAVYYLTEKDRKDNVPVGNFVLFVKGEFVEKILKAQGQAKADIDNDELVLENVGKFCEVLSQNFLKELESNGYPGLLQSPVLNYKNVVPEGVPFDYNLFKKQEIIFSYWSEHSIVIEACMGHVPRKQNSV
jgi:hypothetical protein